MGTTKENEVVLVVTKALFYRMSSCQDAHWHFSMRLGGSSAVCSDVPRHLLFIACWHCAARGWRLAPMGRA